MLTASALPASSVSAKPWVHGPRADVAIGWSWLAVFVVLHTLRSSVAATQSVMVVVFVLSFAHQPLTLGLVYGDRRQREAHARFYRWAPAVAVVAIVAGLNVSLTIVALVAALWNAEHTLMQRYGVLRIYGRKAGDGHGRLEKVMLIAWLVTAVLFLGAFVDLGDMGVRIGVDRTNMRGIEILESASAIAAALFWIGIVTSVAVSIRWVRAERSAPRTVAQRAKWVYAAGTLGLVVAVAVDPLAGVGGYVAAHAIEYFAIVHGSLRRRVAAGDSSPIAKMVRTSRRRKLIWAGYAAAVLLFVVCTYDRLDGHLYGFFVLFFGALHILYDGLVWKLRTPAVAASLGITAAAPPRT